MHPTRERIMDAAWRLFLERGFDGTSVSLIEQESALASGSGSFYRHFQSKSDVLVAVIDREVERIERDRRPSSDALVPGGDARVALAIEFHRRLENLRRLQPLMVLIEREHRHLGTSEQRLHDALVDRNLSLRSVDLASLMDAGLIPERDPDALAATVLAALTGYHLSVAFFGRAPGGVQEGEFVSSLVDLVAGVCK